jgi:Zn-dependent M28 family amino/carboxypeptidase
MSHTPHNLIQRGTIGEPLDGLGPIPALTVGESDGKRLLAAAAGGRLRARIAVEAKVESARGANVIGVLPGESSGMVLVGAHFDSWHAGAADNAGGVAALLALAARQAARGRPRRTLVFAAWDGEELGLFGGYHWLRQHAAFGDAPLQAFVNLEIPSAGEGEVRALARRSSCRSASTTPRAPCVSRW